MMKNLLFLIAVFAPWAAACGDDLTEVHDVDAGVPAETIEHYLDRQCGPVPTRFQDGGNQVVWINTAEKWMECTNYYFRKYTCE